MLVVVMVVLVVAVVAVDVIDVIRMDHRRMPAVNPVDVHVARMGSMNVVGAIRAILDQTAGSVVEMPVMQVVRVVAMLDNRVTTGFVMNVRMIGRAARAMCHDHMIFLPSSGPSARAGARAGAGLGAGAGARAGARAGA
jgi:hypothetical protein